jgi:hypothetical protein
MSIGTRVNAVDHVAAVVDGAKDILTEIPEGRRAEAVAGILSIVAEQMRMWGDHHDKTPFELKESAYRRGFAQGLATAIQYLQGGHHLRDLEKYELTVNAWRVHDGPFESPRDHVERAPDPGEYDSAASRTG